MGTEEVFHLTCSGFLHATTADHGFEIVGTRDQHASRDERSMTGSAFEVVTEFLLMYIEFLVLSAEYEITEFTRIPLFA